MNYSYPELGYCILFQPFVWRIATFLSLDDPNLIGLLILFLPILHVTPIFLLIILAFSINNLYRAKFGERFDYSNLEYKGYEEKTTFVCHLHTKFVTSPFLHLLALDGGCPEVAIIELST